MDVSDVATDALRAAAAARGLAVHAWRVDLEQSGLPAGPYDLDRPDQLSAARPVRVARPGAGARAACSSSRPSRGPTWRPWAIASRRPTCLTPVSCPGPSRTSRSSAIGRRSSSTGGGAGRWRDWWRGGLTPTAHRARRLGSRLVEPAPGTDAITYQVIGVVRSPFTTFDGMPLQSVAAPDVHGQIEIHPSFVPGLADLETFSHLYVIAHLHRGKPGGLTVVPFLDRHPARGSSPRARRATPTRSACRSSACSPSVARPSRSPAWTCSTERPCWTSSPYVPGVRRRRGRAHRVAGAGRRVACSRSEPTRALTRSQLPSRPCAGRT